MPRISVGSWAASCADSSTGSRSRSACRKPRRTRYAYWRSSVSSSWQRSFSQMFVFSTLRSMNVGWVVGTADHVLSGTAPGQHAGDVERREDADRASLGDDDEVRDLVLVHE